MTFFFDPFLGGFGGGGTSQEIAALKAAVFYKDGSASMTGNADYANYAILNLEYISLNDLLIPPGPGLGELKVYSKASGLSTPDPDSALFYKAPNGVEVELLHSGSGAGDVTYSGGAPFPGAGVLAVYDTNGTKINDSFIQIPPAAPAPTPGQVLTVVAAGPPPAPVTTAWGAAGGSGDVKSDSIPAVDSRIVVYNTVSGTNIRESDVLLDESDPLNRRWKDSAGNSLFTPSMGAPPFDSNVFFGKHAGTGTTTVGLERNNTAVGDAAFISVSGAWGTTDNTAVGKDCLRACNGRGNTACGSFSLRLLNSTGLFGGDRNCAFGSSALTNLAADADGNIGIGLQSGSSYSSNESDNIIIGTNLSGVGGESRTTRLGVNQTRCFIEGIVGNPSTPIYENVMIEPTTGQLATSGIVPPAVASSFGQMYFNGNYFPGGTVTPIPAANTWATVAGPGGYFTTPSPDFTYTTVGNVTTMEYTGADTIRVSCGASFCWESATGSSDNAKIALHVDVGAGFVPVQASIQNSKLDDNNFGYPRNGSCRAIFSLSTGHSVAIRVQNNSNTADIVVVSLSIDCHSF